MLTEALYQTHERHPRKNVEIEEEKCESTKMGITFVAYVLNEGVGFVRSIGARREGSGCSKREDGSSGRKTKTARVEGQASEKDRIHGYVVFQRGPSYVPNSRKIHHNVDGTKSKKVPSKSKLIKFRDHLTIYYS